jgi:heat shock protein HslJ
VFETKKACKDRYMQGERQFVRTFSPLKDEQTGEVTAVVVISIEPGERE